MSSGDGTVHDKASCAAAMDPVASETVALESVSDESMVTAQSETTDIPLAHNSRSETSTSSQLVTSNEGDSVKVEGIGCS